MDFLKENDEEIIRNIVEPEHFLPDSFEIVNLGFDVKLVVGVLKDQGLVQWAINPDKKCVQGVKFKKPTWSIDSALEWLKDNQKDFRQSTDKVLKCFASQARAIKGVEVFSAGTWNGDEFTVEDLDAMVATFNETGKTLPPYLKLGHDKEQKLLQSDGLPAAGWVERLYRQGEKLLADFRDIPDKIYKLIDKGAYRKVSIELFPQFKINDRTYKNFVSAVALLGADMPAVQTLGDILARYGFKDYDKGLKAYTDDADSAKIYHYEQKENTVKGGKMSLEKQVAQLELEKKQLLDKIAQVEADAKNFKAADAEKAKAVEAMKADLEKTRQEFKAAAEQLAQAEVDRQVAELEAGKLITPAMKPFVKNLLGQEQKEYSIKIKDEDKKLDKFSLIKETLKLAQASDVNFDDNSADTDGEPQEFSQKAMKEKIDKYMKENKCDYATAYKEVMKKAGSQEKM